MKSTIQHSTLTAHLPVRAVIRQLIFVVLLGVRLSGMDTFSVFWFFFPLFLCSCCIVFAACCCLLCVGPEEEEELDEDLENGLEARWVASRFAARTYVNFARKDAKLMPSSVSPPLQPCREREGVSRSDGETRRG